ncbi:MAG: hypothetical protein WC421_11270 [Elusimicrobiales bacterium]
MTGKTLKSRYLSLKQDGSEMYVEDVALTGTTEDYIPIALEKLEIVRKTLPKAKWSITIEVQFTDGSYRSNKRYYTVRDAETGKITNAEF